jgi:phosphoenolpyruvate carboxylase
MTDITDDIAEEISFQGFDDYCKLLKNLLNDVLQREVGTEFVDKLERNLTLAQVFSFSFSFSFSFFL